MIKRQQLTVQFSDFGSAHTELDEAKHEGIALNIFSDLNPFRLNFGL